MRHREARKKGENPQKTKEDGRRKSKRQKDAQDKDTKQQQKCTREKANTGETKHTEVREGEHA